MQCLGQTAQVLPCRILVVKPDDFLRAVFLQELMGIFLHVPVVIAGLITFVPEIICLGLFLYVLLFLLGVGQHVLFLGLGFRFGFLAGSGLGQLGILLGLLVGGRLFLGLVLLPLLGYGIIVNPALVGGGALTPETGLAVAQVLDGLGGRYPLLIQHIGLSGIGVAEKRRVQTKRCLFLFLLRQLEGDIPGLLLQLGHGHRHIHGHLGSLGGYLVSIAGLFDQLFKFFLIAVFVVEGKHQLIVLVGYHALVDRLGLRFLVSAAARQHKGQHEHHHTGEQAAAPFPP